MKALNERIVLKCATNDTLRYIEWTFAAPQWTSSKIVSRGHTLKSLATERNISITNTPGEYSLIISQVRMHHMGIYVCQECLTGKRTCRTGATAELIVLEYKPMCNFTVHPPTADGTIEAGQHIIDFWCLFAYSNNVLGKLSVRWTDAREIDVRHKTNRQSRDSWIDVESRVQIAAVSPRVPQYTFIACLPIGENENCSDTSKAVTTTRPAVFTWTPLVIEDTSNQPATRYSNMQTPLTTASVASGISTQPEITYSDVKTHFATKYLDAFNITTLQTFPDPSLNSSNVTSRLTTNQMIIESTPTVTVSSGSEQNLFSSNTLYISLVTCGLFVLILVVYTVLRACVKQKLRKCRENKRNLVRHTSSDQSAITNEDARLVNVRTNLDHQLQEIDTYDEIDDSIMHRHQAHLSSEYLTPPIPDRPDCLAPPTSHRPQILLHSVPIPASKGIHSSIAEHVVTRTGTCRLGGKGIYISLVDETRISIANDIKPNMLFVSQPNLSRLCDHQNVSNTIVGEHLSALPTEEVLGLTFSDSPRPHTM